MPLEDDISELPNEMMAELHKNRNPGNHKRFFAFVKISFDMQDDFDSIEVWRKYITMKAGFFDEVVTGEGKLLYWPQSIAWDKMDEIEFKDMFQKVVNAFLKYYGNGLTELQINSIVEF